MTSPTPAEEELLQAVAKLRKLHPNLGRAKFLALLKDEHGWVLSETRLKKCMVSQTCEDAFLICTG